MVDIEIKLIGIKSIKHKSSKLRCEQFNYFYQSLEKLNSS